tara:strand:- start:792 stop:1172 length:381 start_codon:yes stop_codon:yes gene_type:complete
MANVVVVDDSEYMVNVLKQFLQSIGHQVVGFGLDGNEGYNLYRKHSPDLMILDLTMPNRHGRECLFDVLDWDPDAKVLIVSTVKNEMTILECLERGAKGFVEKPLKFSSPAFCDEFKTTIENALNG